jgi:predicted transcriptional regulator
MSDPAILTVRLSERTNDRLAELAGRTRRTRSVLAEEAIAAYVERELAIVEGIECGRADVRDGRVVPHDEVAREARAIVAAARARR